MVASLMLFVFAALIPYQDVEAANALGIHYGGRIVSYNPGYAWSDSYNSGYCQPHITIISYGAPYRGVLALFVPPSKTKANYNWYSSNVKVKGGYYPIPQIYPMPTSCPYSAPQGVYYHSLGGTSKK